MTGMVMDSKFMAEQSEDMARAPEKSMLASPRRRQIFIPHWTKVKAGKLWNCSNLTDWRLNRVRGYVAAGYDGWHGYILTVKQRRCVTINHNGGRAIPFWSARRAVEAAIREGRG